MAIRHGLAGQYGKTEATRRTLHTVVIIVTLFSVGCMVYGLAWGYFWSRFGALPAVLPLAAVVGFIYFVWRRTEPYLDRIAKERIRYLRGGQAEALVAWLLEDLGDEWHIFNGIKLEAGSDIDHVLVGPGGLYCISTKSHRGVFAGTAEGLLHNGQPSDFAKQALRQTMDLKDRMQGPMGSNVPYIRAVLAVPFGYTEADAIKGTVWLVHQENICTRLAPEDGLRKLSGQEIDRIVRVLKMIRADAAEVYERPTEAAASPQTPPPQPAPRPRKSPAARV